MEKNTFTKNHPAKGENSITVGERSVTHGMASSRFCGVERAENVQRHIFLNWILKKL